MRSRKTDTSGDTGYATLDINITDARLGRVNTQDGTLCVDPKIESQMTVRYPTTAASHETAAKRFVITP